MKILILGRRSVLAQYLLSAAAAIDAVAVLDHTDVTDPIALLNVGGTWDYVINCAAMTNVDIVERHTDRAVRVNTIGPANVGLLARRLGAHYVHISTDYVFGDWGPWSCEDRPFPIQRYGWSKWAGELGVRSVMGSDPYNIVRLGWLYGAMYLDCPPMLALGYPERRVKKDRTAYVWGDPLKGIPAFAGDVADKLIWSMEAGRFKDHPWPYIHVGPIQEPVSWYDFLEPYCNCEELRPPTFPARPRNGGLVPCPGWSIEGGIGSFKYELSREGEAT